MTFVKLNCLAVAFLLTLGAVRAQATWERVYFREINKCARASKLRSLRAATLTDRDLEVRVWALDNLNGVEGFVLRRSGDRWSAMHLKALSPALPRSEYKEDLQSPKSGWESFWKQVVGEGILSLSDSSELEGYNFMIKDGFSYVVEINANQSYRTYHYDNPDMQARGEAKKMLRIGYIIAEEFALPHFKVEDRAP